MVNWVERSMDNYLALTQLKIRYNLTSGECKQIAWPFQREKKKCTYFFFKKRKNKQTNKQKKQNMLPHFRDSRANKAFALLEILQVFLLNPTPQLLLDDRTVCIWATVRMPIVHFSVLLVFKKSATQHWTIPDPVCRNSHPNPSQKMAEHRSGISR